MILTRRLILRPFTAGDAPKVYAMSREAGMAAWLPDQVYANEAAALEVLRALIAGYAREDPARAPYVLGVCLGATGELIGHAGLSPRRDEVEVGYAVEACRQGRGYASEAVEALAGWGIREFGLPRVLGIVAADNVPSRKVLERAGFALVAETAGRLHGWEGLVRTYEKRL